MFELKEIILCLFVWASFAASVLFFGSMNDANNTPEKIEERYQAQLNR